MGYGNGVWILILTPEKCCIAMSMNIKSVDYIITAKHYGNGSVRGYIRKMQERIHKERGIAVTVRELDVPAGQEPTGTPVQARIWQGQWIADCECNSASFVDPEEPIFFCFGCGNRSNGSKPRPVIFPAKRQEIERLILERPVDDLAGLTDMERAGMARPVLFVEVNEEIVEPNLAAGHGASAPLTKRKVVRTLPLVRSWEPGETVEDLRRQQDGAIQKWKRELKEGKGHSGV